MWMPKGPRMRSGGGAYTLLFCFFLGGGGYSYSIRTELEYFHYMFPHHYILSCVCVVFAQKGTDHLKLH